MARVEIRSTPNRFHAQRAPPRFRSRNLVNASLSILGRTFRTTIREGASADDLIERIAKENGGGVAKVYYPEFKTWEIVAVKRGDRLLVKGDSKRVADADFSQFSDGESVRTAAIAASKSSDGGIHFSLGESGIPMATTEEQGIVFPNAEELRIGKNINDIALWTTSATFDPQNLNDIDNMYRDKGGTYVTNEALEQISSAHGGDRNEKLMLHDNILVLDKDTGEVMTVSEHASKDMMFMDAPFPPPLTLEPQTFIPSIQQPDMAFDGRPTRVSYLIVKTVDGAFSEHVDVGFNSLVSTEQEEMPQKPEPVVTQPSFSLLLFDTKIKVQKAKVSKPLTKPKARAMPTPNGKTATRQKIPTFASALVSWSMPRTEHICLNTPKSVMPLVTKAPRKIQMPITKTESEKIKASKPRKKKEPRKKKKAKPKPKTIPKAKKKRPPKLPKRKKAKPRIKTKSRQKKRKAKPIPRTIKKTLSKKKLAPETISKKKLKPKVKAAKTRKIRNKLKRTKALARKKALLKKRAKKKAIAKKSHHVKELLAPFSKRKKKSTGRA